MSVLGASGFDLFDWIKGYESFWKQRAVELADEGCEAEAARFADGAKIFGDHVRELIGEYQISSIELDRDVVGELQGGVGTLAAVRAGTRADDFINSEPTDLPAVTMHAAACVFAIELEGVTRHMSKRAEAVDAIHAACDLIPRLTDMTFRATSTDRSTACMSALSTARSAVTCMNGDRHRWPISCG